MRSYAAAIRQHVVNCRRLLCTCTGSTMAATVNLGCTGIEHRCAEQIHTCMGQQLEDGTPGQQCARHIGHQHRVPNVDVRQLQAFDGLIGDNVQISGRWINVPALLIVLCSSRRVRRSVRGPGRRIYACWCQLKCTCQQIFNTSRR